MDKPAARQQRPWRCCCCCRHSPVILLRRHCRHWARAAETAACHRDGVVTASVSRHTRREMVGQPAGMCIRPAVAPAGRSRSRLLSRHSAGVCCHLSLSDVVLLSASLSSAAQTLGSRQLTPRLCHLSPRVFAVCHRVCRGVFVDPTPRRDRSSAVRGRRRRHQSPLTRVQHQ